MSELGDGESAIGHCGGGAVGARGNSWGDTACAVRLALSLYEGEGGVGAGPCGGGALGGKGTSCGVDVWGVRVSL